jgi:hypothetical protein
VTDGVGRVIEAQCRSALLALAVLVASACHTSAVPPQREDTSVDPAVPTRPAPAEPGAPAAAPTTPTTPAPKPDSAAQARAQTSSPMLEGLTAAVQGSPYCALLKHVSVKILPVSGGEQKHLYRARVLETFRGPALKEILYTMSAEPGEKPVVPKQPCHRDVMSRC